MARNALVQARGAPAQARGGAVLAQNLFTQSNALDQWSQLAGTSTAAGGAETNPITGANDVWIFADTAGGSPVSHGITQTATLVIGRQYTYAGRFKAIAGSSCYVLFYANSFAQRQLFDLNAGTKGATSGSGFASRIDPLGSGWYACWFTFLAAAASQTMQTLAGITNTVSTTYTASGTQRYYQADMQLTEGPAGALYTPTTTTAVNNGRPRTLASGRAAVT